MVDTITTLIEKAIQTDNDKEALAVLKMIRRKYRGTGTAVMPKRVQRAPVQEVVQADTSQGVQQRQENAEIAYLKEQNRKLEADVSTLTQQNTQLTTDLLKAQTQADNELTELMNLKVRSVVVWASFAGILLVGLLSLTIFFGFMI